MEPNEGFLYGKRYLIRDRDSKFTAEFDGLLKATGVEAVVLPPRSPNLNAFAERFVLSIKSECLDRMVFLSKGQLERAIGSYLENYHNHRNHQGIENVLIDPDPGVGSLEGKVVRQTRLGGLLNYYHREAA